MMTNHNSSSSSSIVLLFLLVKTLCWTKGNAWLTSKHVDNHSYRTDHPRTNTNPNEGTASLLLSSLISRRSQKDTLVSTTTIHASSNFKNNMNHNEFNPNEYFQNHPYYPPLTPHELQNRKAELFLIASLNHGDQPAIANFNSACRDSGTKPCIGHYGFWIPNRGIL